MAITSWTSESMDWSSSDALCLSPLYLHCEAIRLAVRERLLASWQSATGVFAETFELHLYPLKTFCDAAQSAITTLIPLYANHTDHGGNWDGVASSIMAPNWTEAAVLEAIEAESRLTPDRLSSPLEWLFQQYQILNMLRWRIVETARISYANALKSGTSYLADPDERWAEMEALLSAASWSTIIKGGGYAWHYAEPDKSGWGTIYRRRTVQSVAPPLSGVFDWYAFFETDWIPATYVNNDYSAPNGCWTRIVSGGDGNYSIGDFESNTLPNLYSGRYGWYTYRHNAIFKPALQFKNW